MKGYIFRTKNNEIKISCKAGSTTKFIVSYTGNTCTSSIGTVDYINSEILSLSNFVEFESGEKVEIDLMDIEKTTHPMNIQTAIHRMVHKSKYEAFLALKEDLKKRGLI